MERLVARPCAARAAHGRKGGIRGLVPLADRESCLLPPGHKRGERETNPRPESSSLRSGAPRLSLSTRQPLDARIPFGTATSGSQLHGLPLRGGVAFR